MSFSLVLGYSIQILPLEFSDDIQLQPTELFFDCQDNKFISKELLCDGHENCLNGVDEDFCKDEVWLS